VTDTLLELLQHSLSGAYRVERELGGGGMARVFIAEEAALGRRVVVKILSLELFQELSVERFSREIKLLARLQHPNIVPVLSAGLLGDVPYYTMPLIEGESLRDRLAGLAHGERLPVGHAIDILRDVARALAYAHSAGVVHRDIKPANVLLSYDAAVVADFGIAKALADARTHTDAAHGTTLTQAGVALGTPAYMSPEQAAGDPAVDHRADVYAWGLLAYELLAGAHPFADRHSVQSLITAQLVEQPRALDIVASDVPTEVSALVMRCLAKDPSARPPNGRAIVDALPASTASGGRLRKATRRFSLRRAQMLALVAAIVVVGGAVATYRLWQRPATTLKKGTSSSSPAYDAYLRGKVLVSSESPEDIQRAIDTLRHAITLDANFAPAYAQLSRALHLKGFYFAPDSQKKALREAAQFADDKALGLDPNLAEGYFVQGLLLWSPAKRFPHEQAAQAYRHAISLDSRLDEAHHQLGLILLHVGLFDEALAEIDTALSINPANSLARFRLGVIALYRGDFERAYDIFNTTSHDQTPSLWAFQMATVLFRLGREREATEMIDTFLRDYPNDEGGVGTSVRAMMLAKAGRRGEAETAIAHADSIGKNFGHFHHTAYNIASAYALLGNRDRAIEYLRTAADDGFPCYPLFAGDTQLDGLRKDPRFIAMMAKLERDWNQRKRSF
jgi:serine/threonine protein kinase/Flp pilus assembly protein TadD